MKKLYFEFLYLRHRLLQLSGWKDESDTVIKIWFDSISNDTYLFVSDRSGIYYLPMRRHSGDDKKYYSSWLASYQKMNECFITMKNKHRTIYTLMGHVENPLF
jgi:hypothetical protein